ncbi:MAG: nucleotide exchange factor GrpE, partial [Acidimicrobiales bacterium]
GTDGGTAATPDADHAAGEQVPPAGRKPTAAEAAARVADLLAEGDDNGAEAVDEAGEAVEEDIQDLAVSAEHLAKVEAARDEYLDSLRRLQADFENYKKRIARQQVEAKERAAEELVVKLLPVLDTFDLALAHAEQGVEPIYRSLMDVLGPAGLERIEPIGQPFDPNEHDAVLHEDGDADPEVIEVMRAGYRWKGRVLRPAMVKVKG